MGVLHKGHSKGPFVGHKTGGSNGAASAQASIAVARTTSLNLDGTEQNPTFDTILKADTTGNFSFAAGTSTIAIAKSGSYSLSVYMTTRDESAFTFKLSVKNNGVEIPNIATFMEEGHDQQFPDEYQICLSIKAIDLVAGTLQIIAHELTRSGTGTNTIDPNMVWSMTQNTGLAGANGLNDAGVSTDEFWVFLSTDTTGIVMTTPVNAFKDAAQVASKMSVMYDEAGVVDVANAKVVLTAGTWDITFFVRGSGIESGEWILARIHSDPDGANIAEFEGTMSDRAANTHGASMVSALIKAQAGAEFGFFVNSNDAGGNALLGGATPSRVYAFGKRINADPT